MVPLAATATTASSPTSALVLVALIVTLGYALTCAVWPFRACRRCQGTGRLHGPLRGIRLCRRCTGTGLRLRLGRRIWNHARDLYRHH
jgi:hypothetical protein